MKPPLSPLLLLALLLAGCATGPSEPQLPPIPPPTNAVQREIDAAAALPFERDRRERLKAVAQHGDLDADTQLRLVDAAFRTLPDDEDLETVLVTLIDNPSFTPAARDRIHTGLSRFTFPDTQSRLLAAMARRGTLEK